MDLDHFILDPCLESVEREDQEPTAQSSSNGTNSAASSNEPEVDSNEDSYGKSLERNESQESDPIEELTIHTKLTKKLLDQLIPYQEEDDDYFFDPIFHFHSCPSTDSSLHRKTDQGGKNRVKQTTITPLDFIDTTLQSIGDHTTHHTNYLLDTSSTSFSSLFIDAYTSEDNHHNLSGSLIDSSFDSSMDNLDPMATLYAFNASSGNNNSPPPSCNENTTPPLPLPPPCPDEQSGLRSNPQQPLGNNANDVLTHSSPTLNNNDSSLCLRRSSTSPSVPCPSTVPRCPDSVQSDGANSGSVDHVRDIQHPYQHTGSSSTGYYHFYDNHYPGNGHYHQYHSYPTHPYHEHNWPMSPSTSGPPPQSLVETRIMNHCSTPVSPIQSSTIQFPTGNGSMSVNLSMNMSFTASSSAASSASNAAVEPRADRTFGPTLQPIPPPPQHHHQQILWTPIASPQASYTTEYNYPTSSAFVHSPTSHAYHSEYHQTMPPSNGQVYHQLSSRVIQGDHVRQSDGGYPTGSATARVLLPPIEKEFAGISTFHRHRSSPSSTSVETSGTSESNSESPPTGPMVQTRSQTRYLHSYHTQYQQPRGTYDSGRGQQQRHNHQRRLTSSSSFSRYSDLDDSPPDTLGSGDGPNSSGHQASHANLNLASGLRSRSGMRTDSLAPEEGAGILLSSTVTSASSHGQVDDVPVIVGRPGGHLLVQLDRGSRRIRKGFQDDEKEDDEEAAASAERRGQSDSRDYVVGMETRRAGELRSPGSPLLDHQNLTDPSVSLDSVGQYGAGGPNLCGICGKSYARPSTLKTHLRTHSGERPYRCNMCYKSFSQAANLTAHLRTHSGEKPFTCQICGRRFSQSSSVTTHMRTHSGERPYRCYMCRKAFSDSSTLTKHLRIHSGEKPYQCKLCHLKFSQSGNLNRHMRIHSVGQM